MAKSTTNLVSVDSLVFEDNIRTEGCLNLPGMVESIRRHGFKVNHPLVVVAKGGGNLVLCGNRRGLALQWLRDHENDTFNRVVPTGKIPAVIHEGLSPEQEVLLRIDHSKDEDREPLDEWSLFQAIRQLVMIGKDGQEDIAVKLGIYHTKGKSKGQPNRSYIQPRVNLARLPVFVQDEMAKCCDNPDSTEMRWFKIHTLYKVYNKEFTEYPSGDGPEFQATWKAALTPKEKVAKEGDTLLGVSLTAADARKRAQACQSSLLRDALLTVTGQGSIDLPALDGKIAFAEKAVYTLQAIRAYLGENDYNELIETATMVAEDVSVS